LAFGRRGWDLRSTLVKPSRPRGGGASTSQGHPTAILKRALQRGNLTVAEAVAKELPPLNLTDALELTIVIARKDPRPPNHKVLLLPTSFQSARNARSNETSRRSRDAHSSTRGIAFVAARAGHNDGPVATPRAAERPADPADAVKRPRAPGILLGIGLGGFVDGIVLHQILQWHHLLSSESEHPKTTVAGLQDNTLADGLFHAATWVAVVIGLWILWRRTTDWCWAISGTAFLGWILVGWGLFNLVEGIINHEILGIHHVREGAGHQTAYDLGFLAFGAMLVFGGWLLTRLGERDLANPS